MISAVQVLLLCLFCEAYAQHRNQPTQAVQGGVNYGGYPTATAAYAGEYNAYASLFQNPAPYSLGYDATGQFNSRQFGAGQDGSGILRNGLYGYPESSGVYNQMNYADARQGFRATLTAVGANKQGTLPAVGSISAFNALPTILPPATGSPQEAAAVAYGPRAAAPNTGRYGGYDRSTPDPYALAARSFEYAQYGRYGYGSTAASPGGPFYSNFSPYGPAGYSAGYNPAVNGAAARYGSRPSTHQGYRRR